MGDGAGGEENNEGKKEDSGGREKYKKTKTGLMTYEEKGNMNKRNPATGRRRATTMITSRIKTRAANV